MLRNQMLSTHQQKVAEDRRAQIAFNEELRRQKLLEEQLFSRLWEEDRLAKEMRNDEEKQRQRELMYNTLRMLNAQVESIQAQRMAAQRLKEEEALLVVGLFKCFFLWWSAWWVSWKGGVRAWELSYRIWDDHMAVLSHSGGQLAALLWFDCFT